MLHWFCNIIIILNRTVVELCDASAQTHVWWVVSILIVITCRGLVTLLWKVAVSLHWVCIKVYICYIIWVHYRSRYIMWRECLFCTYLSRLCHRFFLILLAEVGVSLILNLYLKENLYSCRRKIFMVVSFHRVNHIVLDVEGIFRRI